MLLAFCLLSGVSYLIGSQAPNSLQQVMPGWLLACWNVSLLAAGTVGAVGNLWPGHLATALHIRLSGQILTFGPFAAYSVAVFVYAGWRAWFAGALVASWALVAAWNAKHLREDLRHLAEVRQ